MTMTAMPKTQQIHPLIVELTDWRQAAGWTRADLADKLQTGTNRITRWEDGTFPPAPDSVTRWAAALGLRVAAHTHDGHVIPEWMVARVVRQARTGRTRPDGPAAELTAYRRLLGIPQEEVAANADDTFTQSQLGSWEAGRVKPGLWSITRWADALGCDLVLVPAQAEAR